MDDDDYSTLLTENLQPRHLLPARGERYARVRWRRLVRDYLEHLDLKQAARAARIPVTRAQAFLARPDVQSLIESEITLSERMSRVTRADVLSDLRYLADMALGREMTKVIVVNDGVPEVYDVEKVDAPAAKGALELLGKHLALFVDKHEIDLKLPQLTLNLAPQEKVVNDKPEPVHSADGLTLGPPPDDDEEEIPEWLM